MRYRLTLLPEGFVPVAIDAKERVAGFTPQEAAIYEPATRALTTSLLPRIGPNDISVANAMTHRATSRARP